MKKERDIAKLKRWCMRRHEEGVPACEIYLTAQIPRSTFYDWLRRYQQQGVKGFEQKSRRPHTIHRTRVKIVEEIKALRVKRDPHGDHLPGRAGRRHQGRPAIQPEQRAMSRSLPGIDFTMYFSRWQSVWLHRSAVRFTGTTAALSG
jgi:hypothetical protein